MHLSPFYKKKSFRSSYAVVTWNVPGVTEFHMSVPNNHRVLSFQSINVSLAPGTEISNADALLEILQVKLATEHICMD